MERVRRVLAWVFLVWTAYEKFTAAEGAQLGPWSISTNVIESFFDLLFLLAVGGVVYVHWEILARIFTWRRRKKEAQRQTWSEKIKKAAESVKATSISMTNGIDHMWVPNLVYMTDQLREVGIQFSDPEPDDIRRHGTNIFFEGLTLAHLYLLDENLEAAQRAFSNIRELYRAN